VVKIAQPLFVACVVALLAACAPTQTVQAPPPPPPPPPVAMAAPAPEVPYVAPAPRWRHHARCWRHCHVVRHHHRHAVKHMTPAVAPKK
jgi:hypothetical protein